MRKRNLIILLVTFAFTAAILGGAFYIGVQPNYLTISEDSVHVSGIYGVDWPLEEVTNIQLVETIPAVKMKLNGFAYEKRAKGRFRLEDLGAGRLFIHFGHPPFLFIEKGEDYLFINSKSVEETMNWYQEVSDQLAN